MSIHFTPIPTFLLKEEGVSQRSPRVVPSSLTKRNYSRCHPPQLTLLGTAPYNARESRVSPDSKAWPGPIAQWLELLPHKEKVPGSNPGGPTCLRQSDAPREARVRASQPSAFRRFNGRRAPSLLYPLLGERVRVRKACVGSPGFLPLLGERAEVRKARVGVPDLLPLLGERAEVRKARYGAPDLPPLPGERAEVRKARIGVPGLLPLPGERAGVRGSSHREHVAAALD